MGLFKLVCFCFFVQVFYACNNDVKTYYYLPENYEGVFAVVYSPKTSNSKTVKLKREFVIPVNGILITQFEFLDDERNDLFFIRNEKGYDTLKYFLPEKPFVGKNLRPGSHYTHDTSVIAVNLRQVINVSFKIKNTEDYCDFEYELITIGRPNNLNKINLKSFKENLETYLRDSVCTMKR